MSRDTLFSAPIENLGDWHFNEQVADVFADMVQRSVPGYSTILSIIGMLAQRFVTPASHIYDLGCSLGAASVAAQRHIQAADCQIFAVDNAPAMITRCRRYVSTFRATTPIEVIEQDILEVDLTNASMVILNFTLQFLRPETRLSMLKRIWQALNPGGVLFIAEKFCFSDSQMNALTIAMHHDFKRANGYNQLQISQKRTMLENVMLLDTIETHKKRLIEAGFRHPETCFQCLNFGALLALK